MKKYNIISILPAVVLLLCAACTKESTSGSSDGGNIRFAVGVSTKARLIDSESQLRTTSGFVVNSYKGSATTRTMDRVTVSYDTEAAAWTYTGEYFWEYETPMRFYAYYPASLATVLDSKTGSSGIESFSYSPFETASTDVKGQEDYMLATYGGFGNYGVAPLAFSHVLSSIRFKFGNIVDDRLTAVTGIAIGGFYTSGNCAVGCSASKVSFTWTGQSGTADDAALSQTGLSADPAATDKSIGGPFMLIPGQTFTDANPLSVKITATINGKADQTLVAAIPSGSCISGKTTTFYINYDTSSDLSFTVKITDWDNTAADQDITVDEQ